MEFRIQGQRDISSDKDTYAVRSAINGIMDPKTKQHTLSHCCTIMLSADYRISRRMRFCKSERKSLIVLLWNIEPPCRKELLTKVPKMSLQLSAAHSMNQYSKIQDCLVISPSLSSTTTSKSSVTSFTTGAAYSSRT